MVDCVLQASSLTILVLEFSQLVLLFFKFIQTVPNGADQLVDLAALGYRIFHDTHTLSSTSLIHMGTGNLLEHVQALCVLHVGD